MTEWKKVKLGDVCIKIGSGATPEGGSKVYISNGISLIRSQNVYNMAFDYSGLTHITEAAADKLKSVTVFENDILINITGDSVARTCVVPNNVLPARVNQHVCIIRPIAEKVDSKFLNYYLASPVMQNFMLGLAVGKGASRNAMTKMMIENFEIPLPPLLTQRKIAAVLGAYDDLIENAQKQIKLLEEAAMRLYREWFVELRFPGHKKTKITNGLPNGWKRESAENFFEITIGKTPPRKEQKWFSENKNDVPWVSISDMGNSNEFIFETSEFLTNNAIESCSVKIVPKGTVLVSFKLTVGRVAITSKDMCTNEAIAHFHINNKKIREYTYLYLKHFEYDTLGNTSAISQAVNSKIIKAMPFVMPSQEIVEKFNAIVSPYFNQIIQHSLLTINCRDARNALLGKLMNGEIKI